jgi:hypothetical protein
VPALAGGLPEVPGVLTAWVARGSQSSVASVQIEDSRFVPLRTEYVLGYFDLRPFESNDRLDLARQKYRSGTICQYFGFVASAVLVDRRCISSAHIEVFRFKS